MNVSVMALTEKYMMLNRPKQYRVIMACDLYCCCQLL